MSKQQLTTVKDCGPTVVWGDTLMSGDGTFIIDKDQATKYCIGKRCCNNLQMCLAMKEKLDRKKSDEVEQMILDLMS